MNIVKESKKNINIVKESKKKKWILSNKVI